VLARAANADGSLGHVVSAFLKRSNILGTHVGQAGHVVIRQAKTHPRHLAVKRVLEFLELVHAHSFLDFGSQVFERFQINS